MVINSSLGRTDCSNSRIFRLGYEVFAQQVRQPEDPQTSKFVSLPIRIAIFASAEAANRAIRRIRYERRMGKAFVSLTDLEAE